MEKRNVSGDSRLYAAKDDEIKLITVDHSYVQSLVESGSITPEQAQNHPDKNIITRAVGIDNEVIADHFVISDEADMLLLCSDGLSNMLDEHEMLRIISAPGGITSITSELVHRANVAGGTDNITAVLVKL